MSTTTPVDGDAPASQPTTTEAVQGTQEDLVITTDASGVPSAVPVSQMPAEEPEEPTPQPETPSETPAATEPAKEPEAQAADKTDTEILEWAEKKGLAIDPKNPNEVKLARMQLETDRKFHEEQQTKKVIEPPVPLEPAEDPSLNAIVDRQNEIDLKMYVDHWFDANPEMKQYRTELTQIAATRPYLQDMEDVAAHLYRDPTFTAKLRSEGGREALTNLAQKQQAVPPAAGATNSAVYESGAITPQNVYDMIDKNDPQWFQENYKAINNAIAGKT